MSLRLPILIIGITGTVVFLAIGTSGVLPWEFAGPVAATLMIGWVLNEVKEQFKKPEVQTFPKDETGTGSKRESYPERGPDIITWGPPSTMEVYQTGTIMDKNVQVESKGAWENFVTLRKGYLATIEINADEPVDIDLLTYAERENIRKGKTYTPERSRTAVRNANMEYRARRTGLWVVMISNKNRNPVEAGVKITVEGES